MSLEVALQDTLKHDQDRGDGFDRQMADFRKFEQQMTAGGYKIEKERFSIPLMDRVSTSYLYAR